MNLVSAQSAPHNRHPLKHVHKTRLEKGTALSPAAADGILCGFKRCGRLWEICKTFVYQMPPPTTRELATAIGNMGNLHPSLPVWYKNQQ